jgi:hypothetical protein
MNVMRKSIDLRAAGNGRMSLTSTGEIPNGSPYA